MGGSGLRSGAGKRLRKGDKKKKYAKKRKEQINSVGVSDLHNKNLVRFAHLSLER